MKTNRETAPKSIRICEMEVTFFTLTSFCGITVEICTLGASITRLLLPDRFGIVQNVVLTLADKSAYAKNPFYAGAALGPNAGRISNACFSMEGSDYVLTANDGLHNLHGGSHCISFQNWIVKSFLEASDRAELILETTLQDGQDGFPGNRKIQAAYTLTAAGAFHICYTATTDKTTYLNLSNHSYYNLTGDFTKHALSQQLQISADYYTANSHEHLPMSVLSVEKTPFDFRLGSSLQKQLCAYPKDEQLKQANGYNHAFCLSHSQGKADVILYDPKSGRKLEFYTDAPCMVLYSGGYLEGGPPVEQQDGTRTPPLASGALALEAQDFPNAPNSPLFPCCFLSPAETAHRNITLLFRIDS